MLATQGIRAKCLRQGKIYVDSELNLLATQDLMLFFLRRDNAASPVGHLLVELPDGSSREFAFKEIAYAL